MVNLFIRIKAVLFDLDGTIYRGREVVPGAADFVSRLKQENVKYLFVTNRANRSPQTISDQLQSYGIPCTPADVLTSAQATASYLQSGTFYYIGQKALEEALTEVGMTYCEQNPEYVIVGFDPDINYEKLQKANYFIRNGAKFIATNPDKVFSTESGVSPGNGAIVAAVETAAGVPPLFIGKPEKTIINIAVKKLEVQPEESILVGDNLDTDIQAGINADVRTVLILTGVSTRNDVDKGSVKPTWGVEDYQELDQLIFPK